jgi:hypothetical protein
MQIAKDRRRRSVMVERGSWLEEERVRTAQARKYTALVERLEEYRRDKERIYLREQKRLRQKYKNVLQRLEHEHKEAALQLRKHLELSL